MPIDLQNSKTGRFPFDTSAIKLDIRYIPFEIIAIPDPNDSKKIIIKKLEEIKQLKLDKLIKSKMIRLPPIIRIGKKTKTRRKKKIIVCKIKNSDHAKIKSAINSNLVISDTNIK